MPNHAKTHEECRKTVSFLCMKKGHRELTDFMIGRILKLVKSDLNFDDERVPRGICNTCRLLLQKRDSGETSNELPPLFNYFSILIKPNTRTSTTCACLICQTGKCKGFEKHPLGATESSIKTQEPTPGTSSNSQVTIEKRCTKCLSVIGRGYSHSCTQGTRHKNLQTLVQNDPLGAEQIASSVIANKVATPRGTVRLSQPNGRQLLPVTPGNKL
jgi:hypothetical protein